MDRRTFVGSAAAASLSSRFPLHASRFPVPSGPEPRALPFDLHAVTLGPGPFRDAAEVNRGFLMAQDPDRLLHMFRVTAGLPSTAEPLGGWEAPDNELRGHYTGHYLSACALASVSLPDPALAARGDAIVAELAKCQQALGTGYLSAFPEELFDRLRAGRPVWAPFYTIHKIMAGLLDMHTVAGNAQARDVLLGMARWTARWVQPLGDDAMARVLEREYGGMNELLYNLSAVTGNDEWRDLAHRFDHERIFAPLAAGRDELKGVHANTTIPKVIGADRRYELTGEIRYHDVASYFWHEVTGRRAYCTGGTSNGEDWDTDPGQLSGALSGYTQEDCTTYNMLKLTRHLFGWTAEAGMADYYERALFNGILGSQHPADGEKMYYVSLAVGLWKLFGTPYHDYWCCTGTMSEAFSKLSDSIYFHDADGVFVNLFIASSVDWKDSGVRITQETRFPEEGKTTFTIRTSGPQTFALRIRVPYWATGDNRAELNGRPLEGFAEPGGFYVIHRAWRDGDRLVVSLPLSLHLHPMPDDPGLAAVMYGPLVLAGRLGTEDLTPATLRAEPTKPRTVPEYHLDPVPAPAFAVSDDDPARWIKPGSGPLEFQTVGQATNIAFVPFYRIFDERYSIYWRVNRA